LPSAGSVRGWWFVGDAGAGSALVARSRASRRKAGGFGHSTGGSTTAGDTLSSFLGIIPADDARSGGTATYWSGSSGSGGGARPSTEARPSQRLPSFGWIMTERQADLPSLPATAGPLSALGSGDGG